MSRTWNAIKKSFKEDLVKIHDTICPELVKLSNHNDGDIRDLGLSTLGLLKARIGAVIDKYLKDLNQQKLGKVTEAEAEAEVIKSGIKFKQRSKPKKPAAKPKQEAANVKDDGDSIMTDSSKQPKKSKGGPPPAFLERQQKLKI